MCSELEVGRVQMLEVLTTWLGNVVQCVCVSAYERRGRTGHEY